MKCSGLKQQLEELAEQRSADAQQAQREFELGRRHLTAAQQQLQYKADIIHQLTGGLQVLAFFPTASNLSFLSNGLFHGDSLGLGSVCCRLSSYPLCLVVYGVTMHHTLKLV